jgi:hypothetical protein
MVEVLGSIGFPLLAPIAAPEPNGCGWLDGAIVALPPAIVGDLQHIRLVTSITSS